MIVLFFSSFGKSRPAFAFMALAAFLTLETSSEA